ncbi:MAG: hypothetical protein E7297_04955 [Lachnospiraceae bacterium]|jgi:hypothetical protein|nr:hypothetical protein [Lachnospiraceae bacterium]
MNQKNAKWKSIGGILAVTALLLAFFSCFHPIYATNDDVFLDMLAGGAMTGRPEWRLLHVGIVTSTFLHGLYLALPAVNWYGAYLLFAVSFSIAVFCVAVCKSVLCLKQEVAAAILLMVVAAVFPHGITLQYTTISGLLGAAAIGLLFLDGPTVLFYVLLCMGISLRANACIMLVPIIGFYFLWHRKEWKKGILTLLVILFPLLLNALAYSSAPWTDFKTYNTNRETVYDYGGYPSYEENEDFYQGLGLSKAAYEAASERYQLLLTEEIDKDAMVSIAEKAKEQRRAGGTKGMAKVSGMMWAYVQRHLSYGDRPLDMLVLLLWVPALLGMLCLPKEKRKAYLLGLASLLTGTLIMWGYLTYGERMPSRVTQIIYLVELFGLLACMIKWVLPELMGQAKQGGRLSKVLPCGYEVLMLLALLLALRNGVAYGKQDLAENAGRIAMSAQQAELQSYMSQHQGIYLLDMNSFSDYTKQALQKPALQAGDATFFYMGSWMVKSPWYGESLKKLGTDVATLEKSAYYVFRDTPQTSSDYLQSYIKADLGEDFVLEQMDAISCGDGMQFLIYHVKEK